MSPNEIPGNRQNYERDRKLPVSAPHQGETYPSDNHQRYDHSGGRPVAQDTSSLPVHRAPLSAVSNYKHRMAPVLWSIRPFPRKGCPGCAARGAATFASRYSERHGRSAPRMNTGARQDGSRRLGATMQSRRSSAPDRAQNDAPERRASPSWAIRHVRVRSRSASTLGVGQYAARNEPVRGHPLSGFRHVYRGEGGRCRATALSTITAMLAISRTDEDDIESADGFDW